MKKSILAIFVLTSIVFLLSCDVNAFNKLLSKAKEKFVETEKKVEDLNSQDRKANIAISIKEGVEISNENLQHDLSQINALTKKQDDELSAQEKRANDIKLQVNTRLLEMDEQHNELTTSLSKLGKIKANIVKAESDFNKSISSNNGISTEVKQALHKAIDNIKSSSSIAMTLHNDAVNVLEHARSRAEYSKDLIDSALRESSQIRSGDYYTVYSMIHYISDAKVSLNSSDNMFEKVKIDLIKFRDAMKKAEEDSEFLDRAHQALR